MDARAASLLILYDYTHQQKRLSDVRGAFFERHDLSPEITGRVTYLTQHITRWQGRLDYWLASVSQRPLKKLQPRLLIILRIATFELLIEQKNASYGIVDSAVNLTGKRVGRHARGFANAVLRRVARINPAIAPDNADDQARWLSLPGWLWQRWVANFGLESARQLAEWQNEFSALTIRRNRRTISPAELLAAAEKQDIALTRLDEQQTFFRVEQGGSRLRNLPEFRLGAFSFQDRAAGAVAELLEVQPQDIILDVCAAPGTKTAYLSELADHADTGKIYAYDRDPARVQKALADADRHNYRKVIWETADATGAAFPTADAILVDAPCSGTGVIGRRPDIKWRRQPGDIREMAELQLRILQNSARHLKPDGRLVYSTCTLEPEENWQVVEAFLKLAPQFQIDNIDHLIPRNWIDSNNCMSTFPPRDQVDGIFAVRLSKS